MIGYWSYRNLISLIKKTRFFWAVFMSELLYSCTTKTLTKHLEKKLNGNYSWMLHAIWTNLGNSTTKTAIVWPFTFNLTNHPSKTNTTCWRRKDKLIKDISYVWWAKTYIDQICLDTGCSQEDLPDWWTIEMDGKREFSDSVLLLGLNDDDRRKNKKT